MERGLRCIDCGHEFRDDYTAGCSECGGRTVCDRGVVPEHTGTPDDCDCLDDSTQTRSVKDDFGDEVCTDCGRLLVPGLDAVWP